MRQVVALLRCVSPDNSGLPGPLLVLSSSQPLPDVLLLEVDSDLLTPLPAELLEKIRTDERTSISSSAESVLGTSIPHHLKKHVDRMSRTRTVARRRFEKSRDPITKLTAWVETRIWWIDVPDEG